MALVPISQNSLAYMNESRKRPLQPETWKKNVAKSNRNSGKPYVTSKGVNIPGKIFVPQGKVCNVKCRLPGCSVSDQEKARVYQNYWELGVFELQRTYLMGLMIVEDMRTTQRTKYYIIVHGVRLEVCKATFTQVHGISNKIVWNIKNKINEGVSAVKDGRGLHDNRPHRTDQEVVDSMQEHFLNYPQYDVHYSRKTNGEKYLSSDLNVSVMFRHFLETAQYPDCEGKIKLFRTVFKETGLKIGQPKSDTCKRCDELFAKMQYAPTLAEKEQANVDLVEHQTHSDKGYAHMYGDIDKSKGDPKYIVVCCDLQQVLFTPTLTHSDMFYLRQYSTYNQCIYNGGTNKAFMYLWHEAIAHRGVDEIASALILHVRENFQPLLDGEQRTFVCWSDRCRGQNNNFQLVCTLLYLIKEKYFTTVQQKFLCSGHSFLPCDRQFANIERHKERCKAMVPDDWIEIIRESQPDNPFEVKRLDQANIMKIKDHLDTLYFTRPNTLKVTDVQILEINSTNPSLILTRTDFNDSVWFRHVIPAPNQSRVRYANRIPLDLNGMNIVLDRKYFGTLPLSQAKKEDLNQMLKFLSPQHKAFYQNLIDQDEEEED